MPFPTWLVPAVNTAFGIASNIYNASQVDRRNRQEREFAQYMYDQQRKHALQDRDWMANYNDPSNVMARMKDAGLNPMLIYGHGTNAAQPAPATRGSSMGNYRPEAQRVDMITRLHDIYDLDIKKQQVDNLKIQNLKLQEEVTNIRSQYGYRDLKASIEQLLKDKGYYDYKVDQSWKDLQIKTNQEAITAVQKRILEDTQDATIEQAINKTALQMVELGKTAEERKLIQERIELAKKEGTLKDFEITLNKDGVTKTDNMVVRMIVAFFAKITGISITDLLTP